jgi:hypothetical protein
MDWEISAGSIIKSRVQIIYERILQMKVIASTAHPGLATGNRLRACKKLYNSGF